MFAALTARPPRRRRKHTAGVETAPGTDRAALALHCEQVGQTLRDNETVHVLVARGGELAVPMGPVCDDPDCDCAQ